MLPTSTTERPPLQRNDPASADYIAWAQTWSLSHGLLFFSTLYSKASRFLANQRRAALDVIAVEDSVRVPRGACSQKLRARLGPVWHFRREGARAIARACRSYLAGIRRLPLQLATREGALRQFVVEQVSSLFQLRS